MTTTNANTAAVTVKFSPAALDAAMSTPAAAALLDAQLALAAFQNGDWQGADPRLMLDNVLASVWAARSMLN